MKKRRLVFITGAAKGIGYGIAQRFAVSGDQVVICDKDDEKLVDAIKRLREEGSDVKGYQCDITNEIALTELLKKIENDFGVLDVVVNNTGFQFISSIEAFPIEVFRKMLDVMLVASFIILKHAIPGMKKQRYGRIINIASVNGLVGFAGKVAYNSAKHGLIGLTKVAALEGAEYGITANAICPGYVDTALVRNQLKDLAALRGIDYNKVLETIIFPLVPQKRLLQVAEISELAYFLSAESAIGITGQALAIDGGYTAQ